MTDGEKRRETIIDALHKADKPVSANCFAQAFKVSRQIIVGDIALLRAGGQDIIATARGYILQPAETGFVSKIVVQHWPEQTEEELRTIVEKGGEIIDVIVEHPLYGDLQGGLHIKTQQDVDRFMDEYKKQSASLLSQLTGGIHMHTIRCENEARLAGIKEALQEIGILYLEK